MMEPRCGEMEFPRRALLPHSLPFMFVLDLSVFRNKKKECIAQRVEIVLH
jgi:hypothetical protein